MGELHIKEFLEQKTDGRKLRRGGRGMGFGIGYWEGNCLAQIWTVVLQIKKCKRAREEKTEKEREGDQGGGEKEETKGGKGQE